MPHISIISASVRTGRKSHRAALYLLQAIKTDGRASCDVIDLAAYDFPIFHERLKNLPDPPPDVLEYARRIVNADGIVIVTPEYNGGWPPALKNAIDLLYEEWHRKPVGIVTASDGSFGGTQVLISVQYTLWKMRAWTVPARMNIPTVQKAFSEDGTPADPEAWARRTKPFLEELFWCMEAVQRMKQA